MAERVRSVVVTIKVDTNKQTYERKLTWGDETREQFEQRIAETIAQLTEVS